VDVHLETRRFSQVIRIPGGKRVLPTLLFLVVLAVESPLLLSSCVLNPGSGGEPPDTVPVTDLDRKTPAHLIENYLEFVYADMDSVKYEEALDDAYTFELLEEEPDPDFPEGWWDKIEELAIAGNMFKGRANPQNQTVEDILLALHIRSNVVDNTNYPGKPPGETWYKVTTYVDLRVIADDPADPSGVMNFVVNSDQIFVCRPDPDADSLWTIFRQIDQPSIN
jgi:hypothetical protein